MSRLATWAAPALLLAAFALAAAAILAQRLSIPLLIGAMLCLLAGLACAEEGDRRSRGERRAR